MAVLVSLDMRRKLHKSHPRCMLSLGQICICSWTDLTHARVVSDSLMTPTLPCPVMTVGKLAWYFCDTWLHAPKLILKPGPSFCLCLTNVVFDCIPTKLTQDVDVKALSNLIEIGSALSEGLEQMTSKGPLQCKLFCDFILKIFLSFASQKLWNVEFCSHLSSMTFQWAATTHISVVRVGLEFLNLPWIGLEGVYWSFKCDYSKATLKKKRTHQ